MPKRPTSAESRARVLIAPAIASGSGSTRNPVSPSSTVSRKPASRMATTGVPHAIDPRRAPARGEPFGIDAEVANRGVPCVSGPDPLPRVNGIRSEGFGCAGVAPVVAAHAAQRQQLFPLANEAEGKAPQAGEILLEVQA